MAIYNRGAKFNYKIFKTLEAGIVLTGAEAVCAKKGSVDLKNSHVKIVQNQAYLINSLFNSPQVKNSTRTKKLLLHKKQIYSLLSEIKAKRLTLVPTKMYTTNRLVKLEIALAKGKKIHQKKQDLKEKDIQRAIEKDLKDT